MGSKGLRIDNCDEGPVYKNGDIFGTKGDTYICSTSPKSPYFSPSNDGENLLFGLKLQKESFSNLFFYFYFLIQDFVLDKPLVTLKLCKLVDNIQFEGTVSQIFYLGLTFDFMTKNGIIYLIFSDSIFYIS